MKIYQNYRDKSNIIDKYNMNYIKFLKKKDKNSIILLNKNDLIKN